VATSTISNTIENPAGTPLENVRVVAKLMPCSGFRTADSTEVSRTVETTSNGSGVWSLVLEENAGITPSSSYYRITEYIPGDPQTWNVTVGASDQPVLAAQTNPLPTTSTSNYLTQASADARYQALGSLGSGTPGTETPDHAGTAGVSSSASRADHIHPIVAAAPTTVSLDGTASASEGVATSFARSDHGHPAANTAWITTHTPTLTNLTLGDGTSAFAYQRVGRTINWRWKFTLGSTSAVGTDPHLTLPVAPAAAYAGQDIPLGIASLTDQGTITYTGQVALDSGTSVRVQVLNTSGTYGGFNSVTATIPHAWASTDAIFAYGSYEAAS
jgi:hypothetical protein